jgi:predicted RNA binding protein YcfA (HicA-like mRNA interferase family)
MPKIPRDVSGRELCKLLKPFGYVVTRQTGSHIRLTRDIPPSPHNITIPAHNPIRIGTLNNILNDISQHLQIPKDQLASSLFEI